MKRYSCQQAQIVKNKNSDSWSFWETFLIIFWWKLNRKIEVWLSSFKSRAFDHIIIFLNFFQLFNVGLVSSKYIHESISVRAKIKSLIAYGKTAKPWKFQEFFNKAFFRMEFALDSGVRRKKFRGVQGRGSGLVEGRGRRGSPPDAGEFSKFCKKIPEENCKKMLYFRLFCKKNSKPCVKFSRVWTKKQLFGEILRKSWKFWMKIQWKNWIFIYFAKICC